MGFKKQETKVQSKKKIQMKQAKKKILYSAFCRKRRNLQIQILLRGEINQYVNILYSS